MEGPSNRGSLISGKPAKLGDVTHRYVRSVYSDPSSSQLGKGTRQRFRLNAQSSRYQHFIVRQSDDARTAVNRRQRREKFSNPLHAALGFELFDVNHEIAQTL